ncbi:MFS transporter [Pullulanibacillus sp. KACC 23026]|uniref:MFS transporter n=1 Tax=Pullulanibacillus sp. KACC 23026 TaxID=3028315 RepID=UPI0023B02017|nr:MFS transporter [Pullulanibacillus sp. KACC 23026]WEG10909.1 MFS transporter [Pullulanibacillus sp. KACC 23026]
MSQAIMHKPQLVTLKDHLVFQLAVFCFWFSIYIYVPDFGVYLNQIGLSLSAVGVILGSYGISQILLRLPLGLFANFLRGRQKLLLATGFLMGFISGLLFIFFHSFLAILIARLLAGITASMWVTATILYSRYFTNERASQAMSLLQFLTVFAQFISMMLCSFLIHRYGWTFPFWVGTAASLIGLFLVFVLKELDEDEEESQHVKAYSIGAILKQTIRIQPLNIVTLLSFLCNAILFITIFGFSPIYAEKIGITGPALDWLIAAFFVPHTLSSLLLSFKPTNGKMAKGLLKGSTLGLIPLLIAVPFAHTLLIVSLLHFGIGLLLGFCFPILLGQVVKVTPAGIRMAGMGYYQSLYAGGIFLGPLIAGKVAETTSIAVVFWLTALLSAIAFIVTLIRPVEKT